MSFLDPTTTRLSPRLLLSDFMGCDSVYRHGYPNKFEDSEDKLAEGKKLAELISRLEERFGPAAICYGFISPELSQKIVTYQDPGKPSYHRWDIGAAADVRFVLKNEKQAPIYTAFDIDCKEPYSRMITYAESEWICLATSVKEGVVPRKALYENRYVGERKPQYVQYSQNIATRKWAKQDHELLHDWRGRGWPQYHGGGRRQYEHSPVSRFTTIGSFLYDRDLVHKGIKNNPPQGDKDLMERWISCAVMAGAVIDRIAEKLNSRVSITKAYNSTIPTQDWSTRFTLEFVPPSDADIDDFMDVLSATPEVHRVEKFARKPEPRIRVYGQDI